MNRLAALAIFALISALPAFAALQTENVIIVTADGLRLEEVFGGLDPIILESGKQSGVESLEKLKAKFWRDSAAERRAALMPYFWNTLSKEGVILGNPATNSPVVLTNPHKFSFPGYAEILTGFAQPTVDSNSRVTNPHFTVLEFVQKELNLGYSGVGAFGSWDVFNWICANDLEAFYINAGYEAVPEKLLTPGMELMNRLQFEMLTPWDTVRFDAVTLNLGLEYLKANQPRLLYFALGETDDWAHDRRYDRVIETAHVFDKALATIWETVQSMEAYKGKTTLIVTTDHGRGITPADWTDHGSDVPGAEKIWTAVFGPDTPNLGELSDTETVHQGHVAATAAKFLGLDYNAAVPEAAPALAVAFPKE